MKGSIILVGALLLVPTSAPALAQTSADFQPRAAQATAAQAKIDGEWTIYIGARKPAIFRGRLDQNGTKIGGYFGDETAEYPVTGTIENDNVKLIFTIYEGGADVKINVTGKLQGETITGKANMDGAELDVTAQRTS